MAYQKYSTEAIVLRGIERGEADKVFVLYTREFGLVWARATAVRRESSRMRYALQQFAHARVSLVRGARGWRLAGASAGGSVDSAATSSVATFARIAQLLERLVRGEEQNQYLYETLTEAHRALTHQGAVMYPTIELVCVARLLYSLGYLSADAVGTALFTHTMYTLDHLAEADAKRDALLTNVNRAIAETHL